MASDAVVSVLNHVWNVLEPLGHPCALMGGMALAVWSHPRYTRDVDILVGIKGDELKSLLASLEASGCRPKQLPIPNTVGNHSFIHLLYTPPDEFYDVQFDLLLAEMPLEVSALNRTVEVEIDGIDLPLKVLSCEDLILFKLNAGRIIDRADAAMLLRENIDELDIKYLSGWVAQLDMSNEFQQIWIEALPSREMPGLAN
jgi:hypothetical protein